MEDQTITKINEIWEFLKNKHFNNLELTKDQLKYELKYCLNGYIDDVICDKTNNPPDVVRENKINVRIIWNYNDSIGSFNYLDLSFKK